MDPDLRAALMAIAERLDRMEAMLEVLMPEEDAGIDLDGNTPRTLG